MPEAAELADASEEDDEGEAVGRTELEPDDKEAADDAETVLNAADADADAEVEDTEAAEEETEEAETEEEIDG